MQLAIAVTGLTFDQLQEYLPSLSASGAAAVEIGWNLFDELDDSGLLGLRGQFEEAGLRVRSVHAPFGDAGDLSALEEDRRLKSVADHELLLRRMPVLDARYLVIHPGNREAKEELLGAKEEAARRSLAALVKVAEREGIVLALENMLPNHPATKAERLMALVQEHSSPHLGVCFDTGHAHVAEGELRALEVLSPKLVSIHLSDNDTWLDSHMQPPYGTVDWLSFFPALVRSGYGEPLTIETAPWGGAKPHRMIIEVHALINTSLAAAGLAVEQVPRLSTLDGIGAWLRCRRCHHFFVDTEDGQSCACDQRQ